MKRRNKLKLTQSETSEVDMTPMLDIVFIMLIFFIVTTTFVKASGIEISRPSNDDKIEINDQRSISIKAISNEELQFNGRAVLVESIRANVESEKSKNPKIAVSVQVNDSVQTGVLVKIVDQVRLAGIKQVTVSKIL